MSAEPVYRDPDVGVTIPLSTIVGGSETGVLQHLRAGLDEALAELAVATAALGEARGVVDRAELQLARAEARAASWRLALESAEAAFSTR